MERTEPQWGQLNVILEKYRDKKVVLMGDFNARSTLWGKHPVDNRGAAVIDMVIQFDGIIHNNPESIPTYDGPCGRSWPDLTITMGLKEEYIKNWKVIDDYMNTDHNAIVFDIAIEDVTRSNSRYPRWDIRNLKWMEFRKKLREKLREIRVQLEEGSIDRSVEIINEEVIKLCKKYRKKTKKGQEQRVYWWNDELSVKRSKVRALRRRFQRITDPTERGIWREKYRKEGAIYRKMIVAAKRVKFREFLEKLTVKDTFGTIKNIIKDKRQNVLEPVLDEDGRLREQEEEIERALTRYHFKKEHETEEEQASARGTVNCKEISTAEVDYIIEGMAKEKAPGYDGLTLGIILEVYHSDKKILCDLYNRCFREGYFPDDWKRTKVVYIHKEGRDPINTASYRPICLLPVMGKILDKIITNRLVIHLETNNLLSPAQYGFRRGRSTSHALGNIMKYIRANKQNQEHTCLISLDIKNAFNTVKKSSIVKELKRLKMEDYLYRIIVSYMNNRKIILKGEEHDYNVGVPQGSSLGPIIWLIMINELLDEGRYKEYYYIQAFADDVMIIMRSKTVYKFTERAKEALDSCSRWAAKHELEFSIEKCNYTIIASRGDITRKPTIKLNNQTIKYRTAIKYLGILIDNKVRFTEHLDMVKEKALKVVYKLTRLIKKTWGIRPEIVKEIYKLVIEKIVLYAAEIWYTDKKGMNKKLQQVQRPFLILMTRCYRTVATDALNVLAGCKPIYLKARTSRDLYRVYDEDGELDVEGVRYDNTNSETRRIKILTPDELMSLDWTLSETPMTEIKIYTDGSKTDERVGAGVVIYSGSENKEIIKDRIEGGNSYIAELRAIQLAVQTMKGRRIKEYDIYTDSRSALEALRTIQYKDEITEDIKRIIRNDEMKVHLHWVKAHVGIEGNEEADKAAKEAAELTQINTKYKMSRRAIKRRLERQENKNWQEHWDRTEKGRRVKEIFPKIKENRLCGNFKINQAMTGHGSFGAYQRRFHNKDSSCICGEEQTVEHCLFDCSIFKDIRSRLPGDIKEWEKHKFFNDYYCKKAICDIVSVLMDYHIPFTHVEH